MRRGAIALACFILALGAGALTLYRLGQGSDGSATAYAVEVVARDGRLLRPFQTDDGLWRFPLTAGDVDPLFLRMLEAYEDHRFPTHPGVDPFALARASWQWLVNGRVVSGGSTLSMQVARLLDRTNEERSLAKKLREIARALRLEATLGKVRVRELYLSLAPYGGNLEGLRAASLSYFGKEPRRLSPGESALLVSLPQSPEARRPDRFPERARAARDRVLDRMLAAGVVTPEQHEAGRRETTPTARRPMPALAWHAAEEAQAQAPGQRVHVLTIDRAAQDGLERLVREQVRRQGAKLSGALVAIDHRTGHVLARVGTVDPLDAERQGAVDMTRAIRSPGSTLKPFIYALAYEAGLAHPETLVDDRPQRFGAYAPSNFDREFQGTIPAREALQLSLNIPAVALLEAVGPRRMLARFEGAGVRAVLPRGEAPGLAVGLGGLGLRLVDLAQLYAGLARLGETPALIERLDRSVPASPRPLVDEGPAWAVLDSLVGAPAPEAAASGRYAYKTGTSYGHRDAWAVGFDGARTVAVWVGRPDGSAVPGITGRTAAAPILFDAFARLGPYVPLPERPASLPLVANAQLPFALRRFGQAREERLTAEGAARPLVVAYPQDGVRVDLGASRGPAEPLAVKVQGGTPPFVVMLDGRPVTRAGARREAFVVVDGAGFATVSFVDAEGKSASVTVRVE